MAVVGRTEPLDYVKESKLLLDYIAKIDRGEPVMGPNPTAPSPAGALKLILRIGCRICLKCGYPWFWVGGVIFVVAERTTSSLPNTRMIATSTLRTLWQVLVVS